MTPTPAEISPPRVPVEIFKDFLEENPAYVGLQDAPTFDREAAYLRWLEGSGTLGHLGTLMARALDGAVELPAAYLDWLKAVDAHPHAMKAFPVLCAAFNVPAVFVEVGYADDWTLATTTWRPPSPALAAAVLREAVAFKGNNFWWWIRGHFLDNLQPFVRRYHSEAVAYRIKLNGYDWHTRPL